MATRTASVSGKFSSTATWGGAAVPVDSDVIIVNVSIDVEFDVDQSGFTNGLGASTINGTIHVTNTAGSYYWKCNGTVTWGASSVFRANNGTPGQPLPANVTFEQHFNGAFQNTFPATMTFDLHCQDSPVNRFVKLSQAQNAADTVMHVDTDVTGDSAYWKAGAVVRIDNINAAAQSEEHIISGSPTSATITLTAGLTNSKLQGAYIFIISRNVKITGTGTAQGTAFSMSGNTTGAVELEVRNVQTGYLNGAGMVIGGTISGVSNGSSGAVNDVYNAVISGASNAITGQAVQPELRNGIISGSGNGLLSPLNPLVGPNALITGCGLGVSNAASPRLVNTKVINCTQGVAQGGDLYATNTDLRGCTNSLVNVAWGKLYNCLFSAGEMASSFDTTPMFPYYVTESFDHNQAAGAYKNWCFGGTTVLITAGTVYSGRAHAYQHGLINVSGYSFRDQLVTVPPGGWVNVTCFIQKDASMSYLPGVQIFPASKMPLVNGSPDTFVRMSNSTNTWEILQAQYQNTTTVPQPVVVRTIGQNGSGNVWEDTDISVSPFGYPASEAA